MEQRFAQHLEETLAPLYKYLALIKKTGRVSKPVTVSSSGMPQAYSCEFSPNGKVLYVTTFNQPDLFQYDLSKWEESAIQGSKTNLSTSSDVKSCLQIGYDHKIYVSKDRQGNIGVINNPNKLGKDCNFDTKAIQLPAGSTCRLGFPNFIQSYFKFKRDLGGKPSNDQLLEEGRLEELTYNVYFETGSAKLTEESQKVLDEVIKILENNPGYIAVVSSHTDCQGSEKSNLKLSQKRAKNSANYLNKGLKKKINEGVGYGESKPAEKCKCADCTPEQNAKNRRTEIKLIPKKVIHFQYLTVL